jgi:hypothetical protein
MLSPWCKELVCVTCTRKGTELFRYRLVYVYTSSYLNVYVYLNYERD